MKRNFKDPLYKQWRLSVYTRDKFKCQYPGCSINKKLNAHHIKTWADFPGLRYNINNGITLCKTHHDMIKGMEESYSEAFLRIAYNNGKLR
jgi:predicted restriction endonuclease